jgi:putative transposase
MKEYRKGSHCLFGIKIHLVWITKYRDPILYGEESLRIRDLIRRICAEIEVGILAGNVIVEYIKNQDEIEKRKRSDNFIVGF